MKTGNPIVERNLARAATKWRGSLFLKRTSLMGSAVCLGSLLLAGAILAGWIVESSLATALLVLLLVVGLVAWIGLIVVSAESDPDRRSLANAVERSQPKLLDRVHTLVALEKDRREPGLAAFYRRIALQAQEVLQGEPTEISVPSQGAETHLLIFLVLLVATVFVYSAFSPWRCMEEARKARLAAAQTAPQLAKPETTLELASPTNASKEKLPWGEVRITDPARDLQVTKVDVVPLQIEAAANEPLQKVAWASALNGQTEQPHPLPPPTEPRFAVYQPVVYLDELRLSDWDVVSYYAKANAAPSNSYASEVYFLEVRPFREDILKMPGGEEGKAMQCINELSSLIGQQQHVIRQTHQHAQSPPDSDKAREQDRKKLADAETDLSQGANHLYARMATDMENKPIGEALDSLAKAEKSLAAAAGSLRKNVLPEGQKQERGALAELVAARKAFQKSVSEHPGDFKEQPPEETPPVADSKDKLKEMAEFRDEAKAAQDYMRKLVERQESLSAKARLTNDLVRSHYPRYAQEEKQIREGLEQFEQEHPQVFKPVGPEAEAAGQSLQQAERSLANRDRASDRQLQEGAERMRQLAQALQDKSAERQLTDAYKLKQMLDRQIEKIGQCQNPGAGGGPSTAEVKQTVAETRQTLKELKNVAEQSPTSEAFGPELREALSPGKMMSLNWPLGELEQAESPEARKQPASQAKEGLQKVSKAFEQSQPKAMQMAEKSAKGKREGEFERGMSQLESLVKQLEAKRPLSRQNQQKLGQEALQNLQGGLPEKGGSNERGNQILQQLEKELKKGEEPVDVVILKSLLDALQAYSVELLSKKDAQQQQAEMSGIDPSRLPAAYRGRIEKYFQKLSEK